MLTLQADFKLTPETIKSPNLCSHFTDSDLTTIGAECSRGYQADLLSRRDWQARNEAGMNLALQVAESKSFPWQDCSNVKFPLITIAALQSHARMYPALVTESDLVKTKIWDADPQGVLHATGERISATMTWQLTEEDTAWVGQTDQQLLNLSIVGTNYKKSRYSSALRHNVSELVLAKDLVLDYWAKSVDECPRKTHRIPTFRNEVREKVLLKTYRDVLAEGWYTSPVMPASQATSGRAEEDKRRGVSAPQADETTPIMLCEQHCNLDLDQDGYAEPYIITFEESSGCVCRIVTRFNDEKDVDRVLGGDYAGDIIRIRATEYFTQYTFIPSADGSVMGMGFGLFLGPLNEAVNSLVNMLCDAGTMQTTAGGFLGRGAKIRSGQSNFSPFEWKRVDANGDDIRKNVFPLPVNAPSDVLFQLLSLLINYTNRVAGTTDAMVGENPGQNTPAQTMQTMVEMGQQIYSAIFKRVWHSMAAEYYKLYRLNSRFMDMNRTYPGGATLNDFLTPGISSLCPVADPKITSKSQRQQLATMVKQSAAMTPGYDRDAVEIRWLKAMDVDGIEEIFKAGSPPPVDPKMQIEQMRQSGETQRKQMELAADQQQFVVELMEESRVNNAKIIELQAKAEESAANAQSEMAYAQVALINAEISQAQNRGEEISRRVTSILKAIEIRDWREIELKKLSAAKKEPLRAAA